MQILYGESCSDIPLLTGLAKAGIPTRLHLTAYHIRKGSSLENPILADFRYGMLPICLATEAIYMSPLGRKVVLKVRNDSTETSDPLKPFGDHRSSRDIQKDMIDKYRPKSFGGTPTPPGKYGPSDTPEDHLKDRTFDDILGANDDEEREQDKW